MFQSNKLAGQACLTPTSEKTNNSVGDGYTRPANKAAQKGNSHLVPLLSLTKAVILCYTLNGGSKGLRENKNLKKLKPRGMTLLELLIGTIVIMILLALIGFQLKGMVQKAKVSAAKATMNGFALCLSMAKDDTNLYPEVLSDLKKAVPPSHATFSFRGWSGPYGGTLSLNDPWGNEYQYELSERTVFGPETIERETGKPYEETFTFDASPGPGTLIIDNPGVTSGNIILNGEEIVTQNEFKHTTPTIIKSVTLLSANTITIKVTSKPGLTIAINITAKTTSKEATFTLWSWGKDGCEGGEKYNTDIVYGIY